MRRLARRIGRWFTAAGGAMPEAEFDALVRPVLDAVSLVHDGRPCGPGELMSAVRLGCRLLLDTMANPRGD